MPKGMQIRRPQELEMHATIVNIPEGADVLHYLNKAADDAGYIPVVILSGMGLLSKGVFRVPNDDALAELQDVEKAYGIRVDEDFQEYPEMRDLPFVIPNKDATPEDMPDDFPKQPSTDPKPHWSSVHTFEHPLTLIYAHGGRRRKTVDYNYHFIMSGSNTRPTGNSETFVGQLLPGCIAMTPLQFIVGISATHTNATVQAWTVSIEPGYEVLERLRVFVKARQNIGDCFILSASRGKLSEAQLTNITEGGAEEVVSLPQSEGPYAIEGMTGMLNADPASVRIHAAVVLNCGKPPCDSAGGQLTHAVVCDGDPLDIYLGEMTEERDMTHELS